MQDLLIIQIEKIISIKKLISSKEAYLTKAATHFSINSPSKYTKMKKLKSTANPQQKKPKKFFFLYKEIEEATQEDSLKIEPHSKTSQPSPKQRPKTHHGRPYKI